MGVAPIAWVYFEASKLNKELNSKGLHDLIDVLKNLF